MADENAGDSVAQIQQYLTFMMATEEYGVDILSVQEIRGWDHPTLIPNAPEHVRGVINLRGIIVPIIDLRLRFGLPALEISPVTVVIVLRVQAEQGERIMGIVVDAVSDVYDVRPEQLRPAPDLGHNVDVGYIRGLISVQERMVVLLDVDTLLNSDKAFVIAGTDLSVLHAKTAESQDVTL
ncbi:MAG: purine-binding chemotaxis protein CheW [Pseudomonadales bacterium]|nr:purine-binding chemotaxis protein CheW [Pseudomonadales bacterium]